MVCGDLEVALMKWADDSTWTAVIMTVQGDQ